jgi:hypothetical protein
MELLSIIIIAGYGQFACFHEHDIIKEFFWDQEWSYS